jgi:DNA end-binding protein Ku
MASRALWRGAISFGLVHIPVRLHTATRDTAIHFHLLTEDGTCRLRRKLVCPDTGEEVEQSRASRGFEIEPGRYVVVEDEELEALRPAKAHTIEIEDFVSLSDIDPVYLDRPYWVSPGEGGAKPYRLLVEALQESGKVGIARFVLREKESLVAVRVIGEALALSQLHWAEEVIPASQAIDVPHGKVDARQKTLALQLIEQLTTTFDPKKYPNRYRDEVRALLERKAQGEAIEVREPTVEKTAEIIDLQAALEASLRGGEAPAPKRAAPRRRSTTKAKGKEPAKRAPAKKRATSHKH